jgi:predicted small secreted protein
MLLLQDDRMRMLALALLAASVLLSGCINTFEPAACSGVGADARAGCIYKEAVMAQEPYTCYQIEDMTARSACLRDATDQKAKLNYTQKAKQQPAQVPVKTEEKPPAEPQANTTGAGERGCEGYLGDAADSCYRDLAFQKKDLLLCKKVVGTDARSSCISTVAFTVKNPAACTALENEQDISLCNFYSKGSSESG